MTLSDVKKANKQWFAPGNMKFFGDKNYRILKAKSNNYYLVRKTSQWSDMFGYPKKYTFRLNPIENNLKIGFLLNEEFNTLDDVKTFLSTI